jgi:hypothetical protein
MNIQKYLPVFNRILQLENSRFAGYSGGGISLYPRTNYRNENAKAKIEVSWSTYGSMDFRQAAIFQKNLTEAIHIAKKLSGKLTEKEFRQLKSIAHDNFWATRTAGRTALQWFD